MVVYWRFLWKFRKDFLFQNYSDTLLRNFSTCFRGQLFRKLPTAFFIPREFPGISSTVSWKNPPTIFSHNASNFFRNSSGNSLRNFSNSTFLNYYGNSFGISCAVISENIHEISSWFLGTFVANFSSDSKGIFFHKFLQKFLW